ncbi:MAG: peptide chain release factor 2 [Clostridia bacterium]
MIDTGITKTELNALKENAEKLIKSLDIENAKKEIEGLEAEAAKDGFWNDSQNTQRVLQRMKVLKDRVAKAKSLKTKLEDCFVLLEFFEEDPENADMGKELMQGKKDLEATYMAIRMFSLLNGPNDKNNAYLTLHAGAGGTEACDWVEMLFRMYTRYFENNGFKYAVTDYLEGEGAGIKSVTVYVEGEYAFGYLRGENGVHRLVRISPFDAAGRRHTSFASCEIIPEISQNIEITINPEDLRIDTYRSSGKGGQHINKTDSAVRITHIPTNTVAACQSERSQFQNKDTAMKMLISKLEEARIRENKAQIADLKGVQKEISWGSQIRSYVFCPYTMVKDHRTEYETGDVAGVMDGNIEPFINEYLAQNPTID